MISFFKDKAPTEPIRATADVEITASDSESPARIRITAYRDKQEMSVPSFGAVSVALTGMDLPESIPLLLDHENKISAIAGSGSPAVSNGELVIEGTIARDTDAGRSILALHKAGVKLQASIGADPTANFEVIEAGQSRHGITATKNLRYFPKTKLKEVSLVAIGAASGTTVDIAAKGGGGDMPTTEIDSHDLDRIARLCGNDRETYLRAIGEGWTVQETMSHQLEKEKAARPTASFVQAKSADTSLAGDAFETALMIHAGGERLAIQCYGEEAVERARPYRRKHVMDFLEDAIKASGEVVPSSATKDEIIRAALSGRGLTGITAVSSFSTMNIPTVMSNVQNKSLQQHYRDFPSSWEAFATPRSNRNFKEARAIRPVYDNWNLKLLPPTGEIKHTTMGEKTYGTKLFTWARMMGVSRHDLINDDVGFLAEIPAMLGRLAKRTANQSVWEAILSNEDYDGNAFFHADNGNLLSGASYVLSLDAIGEAVRSMRVQAESGEPLDIQPAVLVVSPKLEQKARQILSSTEFARDYSTLDNAPTANPLPPLELRVESRLSTYSGADEDDWYLFARPGEGSLYFVTLDGINMPVIEQADTDFNTLGIQWRCYHDHGAWLGDPKTAVKGVPA